MRAEGDAPHRPVVVQKYGGSSVADTAALKRVAQAVVARHRSGQALVVVVSAMGKSTDALLAQAHAMCASPPRRELDMLVTAGERMSMALLCMAIAELGEHAISFTGSQSGIITDTQHQGARILEVRPERICAALRRGQIVICAGYQGVSYEREITTLGRGGSDTTAVALAAALAAEVCEIYSDVDGVYSSDPNVCAQARLLPEVPYTLMQAMAGAGARVLNADAVAFARRAGITVVARKTGDSSGRQSCIGAAVPQGKAVAVVGLAHASWLAAEPGADAAALLSHLVGLGARLIWHAPNGLLFDRSGMAFGSPLKGADVAADVAAQYGHQDAHGGLVTVLGAGPLADLVAPLQAALRPLGLAEAPYVGSDTALAVLVPQASTDEVTCLLHARFVG